AAPHNLYTSVAALAGASTTHDPPPQLFQYVSAGSAFTGPGVVPVGRIGINFPNNSVLWDWKPVYHAWLRTQDGTADVDRAGLQINAANIVVQFVPYVTSAMATGEGGPPAPIPTGELVGTGTAWYFSNGHFVRGTWARAALTTRTAFKDAKGAAVRLTPGR